MNRIERIEAGSGGDRVGEVCFCESSSVEKGCHSGEGDLNIRGKTSGLLIQLEVSQLARVGRIFPRQISTEG